jgi:hypothetical protein
VRALRRRAGHPASGNQGFCGKGLPARKLYRTFRVRRAIQPRAAHFEGASDHACSAWPIRDKPIVSFECWRAPLQGTWRASIVVLRRLWFGEKPSFFRNDKVGFHSLEACRSAPTQVATSCSTKTCESKTAATSEVVVVVAVVADDQSTGKGSIGLSPNISVVGWVLEVRRKLWCAAQLA